MSTAPKAYLDKRTMPVLQNSVCGFLDVLGFSNLSEAATSRHEAQHVLPHKNLRVRRRTLLWPIATPTRVRVVTS